MCKQHYVYGRYLHSHHHSHNTGTYKKLQNGQKAVLKDQNPDPNYLRGQSLETNPIPFWYKWIEFKLLPIPEHILNFFVVLLPLN